MKTNGKNIGWGTKVCDWFKENHGDDPWSDKINNDITFADLNERLANEHPDDIIFIDGASDTTARDYVLDCLDEIKFEHRMGKVFDRLDVKVREAMPKGWSLRNLCCGCAYLECEGIASPLELRLHDDHPNDFSMNLVGAGTFFAHEFGYVRNYYMGATMIMNSISLHDAILEALTESDRITNEYVKGRLGRN